LLIGPLLIYKLPSNFSRLIRCVIMLHQYKDVNYLARKHTGNLPQILEGTPSVEQKEKHSVLFICSFHLSRKEVFWISLYVWIKGRNWLFNSAMVWSDSSNSVPLEPYEWTGKGSTRGKNLAFNWNSSSQHETRLELFSVQRITVLKWRRCVSELKGTIFCKFVSANIVTLNFLLPLNKCCPKIRRYLCRFWALSQNCENRRSASSCLSVCPSVRTEQLGSHRTDFREIWYLDFLENLLRKFKLL
jgi:hypothetical protein